MNLTTIKVVWTGLLWKQHESVLTVNIVWICLQQTRQMCQREPTCFKLPSFNKIWHNWTLYDKYIYLFGLFNSSFSLDHDIKLHICKCVFLEKGMAWLNSLWGIFDSPKKNIKNINVSLCVWPNFLDTRNVTKIFCFKCYNFKTQKHTRQSHWVEWPGKNWGLNI